MPDAPPGPVDRVHAPLLARITEESLDESYQHAAQLRAGQPASDEPNRRTHWVAAAVVGVFGVLVTVAAVQTSEGSSVATANRDSLVGQIDQRRDQAADLERRLVDLRTKNVGLQEDLAQSTRAAQSATDRTGTMAARAGFGPVHGPGTVITVKDAPDGTTVRDEDLALLANGLWEAGAEAISINGQRLTARSAIRNAGAAINVNGQPLSPPYVVAAVGNKNTLQADLLDTTTGLQFSNVAEALGFPVQMQNVDDITLPAAPQRMLRLLTVAEGTAKQNREKLKNLKQKQQQQEELSK